MGARTQGSAALHPGLFSRSPSGGRERAGGRGGVCGIPGPHMLGISGAQRFCSADLLVGCAGGVLAAGSMPRSTIPFAHTVAEQTVFGVGQKTHATAGQPPHGRRPVRGDPGQEAGATNSLTPCVKCRPKPHSLQAGFQAPAVRLDALRADPTGRRGGRGR